MNKSLKELSLKKSYDPSIDGGDVINDFYIPCLSLSIKYDRCSAYFSSAVLKQFSPSCGSKKIYDGSFSGKKIAGSGMTARLLKENNIKVLDEYDFLKETGIE